MSADGRFVVFVSNRTVVPGQADPNDADDVFLFDRAAGTTRLVSHMSGSPTAAGHGTSYFDPVISADGNYVAFFSTAQLLPGLASGLYLYSRSDGSITLVSHQLTESPTISADGSYVAFASYDADLVSGVDTNNAPDVFLYERSSGTVTLVSRRQGSPATAGDAASYKPSISADGNYVAFVSDASDLVPGPDLPQAAVFLFDRSTGGIRKLGDSGPSTYQVRPVLNASGSHVAYVEWWWGFESVAYRPALRLYSRGDNTLREVGEGLSPSISADGAYLCFAWSQVYVFSVANGSLTLASPRSGSPSTPSNGSATEPVISADGSSVAFLSTATDLVPGTDTNNAADVFVYRQSDGSVTLASHAAGLATQAGSQPAYAIQPASVRPSISADGAYVAFGSRAMDLVPTPDRNGRFDAFLFERATGTNSLLSRRPPGPSSVSGSDSSVVGARWGSSVSADGRFVVFSSSAWDLVSGQVETQVGDDVFLYDRATGGIALVSHAEGQPTTAANGRSGGTSLLAYGDLGPVISADGSYVVFVSEATDLVSAVYNQWWPINVFLYERATGTVTLVSRGHGPVLEGGNYPSLQASISGDGSYVAFLSSAWNLAPGLAAGQRNVFLFSRSDQSVKLVTHAASSPDRPANGYSSLAVISVAGNEVAFVSDATDLVPSGPVPGRSNVFLYSRLDDRVTLVSHAAGRPLDPGNSGSGGTFYSPLAISADGLRVAFESGATDLVSDFVPGLGSQVFLWEREGGTISLVSHAAGSTSRGGNDGSFAPALSADGSVVAFTSWATDLIPGGEADWDVDVFLYTEATGAVSLVSHVSGQANRTGNEGSFNPAISSDGGVLAFLSYATDLVAGQDTNSGADTFLFRRSDGSVTLASHAAASSTKAGNGVSPPYYWPGVWWATPSLSADGRYLAFPSLATDLVADDLNSTGDVFLFGPAREGADVAVVALGPASVVAGTDAIYTLVVVNNGAEEAQAVRLSNPTPAGLVLLSTSGDCTALPCGLGSIPAGESRVVRLTFRVPSGYTGPEPIVSAASASSFTPDPNPSNNADSSTTAVVRSADLSLELTGPASATPPSHLAYTMVVTNHGPSDAAGVVLSDPDPSGLTLVSHEGHCGTGFPCALGTVRAGTSRTIRVVFALAEGYAGPDPIANVASVATTTADPDSDSDQDTVWTTLDAAVATQGFYTLTPCRLVDTRDAVGPRGGPALSAGWERFFPVAGACGVPDTAKAIAVNVAVTASTAAGHLRLYPAGAPVPLAAAVSYAAGQTRSSNAVARLNAAGELAVYCGQGAGTAHMVLDVVGYFE